MFEKTQTAVVALYTQRDVPRRPNMTARAECRIVLVLEAYRNMTAGATYVLPETDVRAHLFFSEHLDGDRGVAVVKMPRGGSGVAKFARVPRGTVRLEARRPPPADVALSRAATIGIEMFARSTLAVDIERHRPFLVPVGGALLYVEHLREGATFDVELRDWNDKSGNDGDARAAHTKGVLRVRVQELALGRPFEARARASDATRDNYWALQRWGEARVGTQLDAYRALGLRPASRNAARTHVIRYVVSPSGRLVPAAYFLDARPAPAQWRAYWERAMAIVLELACVSEREFLAFAERPSAGGGGHHMLMRLVCQAAALLPNAGVAYVNDHDNRGSGPPVDLERFLDALVTRAGDCEDVARLAYMLLVALRAMDTTGSRVVRHAARALRATYVPMMTVAEAVDVGLPERATLDAYERADELICHIYTLLVPRRFVARAISRTGADGARVVGGMDDDDVDDDARVYVCEGTTYQDSVFEAYAECCAAECRERVAALVKGNNRAMALVRRGDGSMVHRPWTTPLRIADAPPFYGRVITLTSDCMAGDGEWCFACVDTRTGRYGVPLGDIVARAATVALRALPRFTAADHAIARDALRQTRPLLAPLAAPATVALPAWLERRLDALRARYTRRLGLCETTACTWERQLHFIDYRWPLDALPTEDDIATLGALLAARTFAGLAYRCYTLCGGIDVADDVCAAPVAFLNVKLFIV